MDSGSTSGAGHLVADLLAGFALLGKHLRTLEQGLLSMLFVLMLALVAVQAAYRIHADASPEWIGEALGAGLLWMVMVGAVMACGVAGHLRVDLADRLLPPAVSWIVSSLTLVFSGLVCLYFAVYSLRAVGLERSFNETTFLELPAWYVQLILPLGFLLMATRLFACALTPVLVGILRRKEGR